MHPTQKKSAKCGPTGCWRVPQITRAADKGYDTKDFVRACRDRNVTPHVAQNNSGRRRSAIDARMTSRPGYGISQRVRKRVEEIGALGRVTEDSNL